MLYLAAFIIAAVVTLTLLYDDICHGIGFRFRKLAMMLIFFDPWVLGGLLICKALLLLPHGGWRSNERVVPHGVNVACT